MRFSLYNLTCFSFLISVVLILTSSVFLSTYQDISNWNPCTCYTSNATQFFSYPFLWSNRLQVPVFALCNATYVGAILEYPPPPRKLTIYSSDKVRSWEQQVMQTVNLSCLVNVPASYSNSSTSLNGCVDIPYFEAVTDNLDAPLWGFILTVGILAGIAPFCCCLYNHCRRTS